MQRHLSSLPLFAFEPLMNALHGQNLFMYRTRYETRNWRNGVLTFQILWRGKVYRRKQSSFQAPEHHIHQSPITLAIVISRVNLLQTTYLGADINITVVCFWTLSCGTFNLRRCVFLSFFKESHAAFVEICDWKQGHLFPEDWSMAIQACSVNFYFSWRKIVKVQSGFLFLGLAIPWLICGLCWCCIIEYNVLK